MVIIKLLDCCKSPSGPRMSFPSGNKICHPYSVWTAGCWEQTGRATLPGKPTPPCRASVKEAKRTRQKRSKLTQWGGSKSHWGFKQQKVRLPGMERRNLTHMHLSDKCSLGSVYRAFLPFQFKANRNAASVILYPVQAKTSLSLWNGRWVCIWEMRV